MVIVRRKYVYICVFNIVIVNHTEKADPATLNIALMLACWNSDIQNVQNILQTYNVNTNCKDLKGRTPLHFSCIKGEHLITKLLLRHNAKAHVWDSAEKVTPLHCAAK